MGNVQRVTRPCASSAGQGDRARLIRLGVNTGRGPMLDHPRQHDNEKN